MARPTCTAAWARHEEDGHGKSSVKRVVAQNGQVKLTPADLRGLIPPPSPGITIGPVGTVPLGWGGRIRGSRRKMRRTAAGKKGAVRRTGPRARPVGRNLSSIQPVDGERTACVLG